MANMTHDKPLTDDPIPAEDLSAHIEALRGDVWLALSLLENPVFSNDTERALDLLRAIANEL